MFALLPAVANRPSEVNLMRKLARCLGIAAISLATFASSAAFAAGRNDFKVCWTIYAGWMPWGQAKTQGIVSKWAKNTASTSMSCS